MPPTSPTTTCPKCGYQRQPHDQHILEGICPACGIAYQKWLEQNPATEQQDTSPGDGTPTIRYQHKRHTPWLPYLQQQLLYIPEHIEPLTFCGRTLLWVVIVLWGWSFILAGLDWQSIGNSFMHNINLPFHEFGHVLFMPLGRFMSILGGSLFQVLLPIALGVAFLIKNKDPFAAAIMLWWCGQSFIDLSPYIADASHRGLPLIHNMSEANHDWGNILSQLGWLSYDYLLARASFTIGCLLLLASMGWSGYLLYLQRGKM